jgi:hypothetical protein
VSTVQEIKIAAAQLSAEARAELLRWLAESEIPPAQNGQAEWLRKWTDLKAGVNAAVGVRTWTRDDLHAR